uniref:RRM domain-containing protein n=1 Tax=Saimiri boliviensis boliviensis TaxID=39432 RepID=A0A2K6UHK8_SAIBB
MADDIDIEAMMEAPYKKDENKLSSANGREECSKKREKSKSRSRSHEQKRGRERKKSKSRERQRSRSKERRRNHSGSRDRRFRGKTGFPHSIKLSRRHSGSKSPFRKDKSLVRDPTDNLTPKERHARTVFCMQLMARIRPRDLEQFFSTVEKVPDVRIISERNSRRSKGIAYVKFFDVMPLATGLTGRQVLGVPLICWDYRLEPPRFLYVGSLHFNITEDRLPGMCEPFRRIESIQLMTDSETGRSKGYGFITFSDSESVRKALEQLNGFDLAGRPMRIGPVTECTHLMARLAEGTGLQIPPAAQQTLQMSGSLAFDLQARLSQQTEASALAAAASVQPFATQCLQPSNMFSPQTEVGWDTEIKDDVIEECNKHGGLTHIYVNQNSAQGNVYVKCPSIAAAIAAISALHGRWFVGKMITAAYVPLPAYHNLFPDSMTPTQLLFPSRQ